MNRDRTVAGLLALLLLASLVLNWVLWRKSRESIDPTAAVPAVQPEARKSPPRERGGQGRYELVANPEMKGRLGRVVIAYAEGVTLNPDYTHTIFYKEAGTDIVHSAYGPVAAELAPGIYDLEVNGKKIAGIPVKSGQDTRVPSGVLRLHGSKETRFPICDVGVNDDFRIAYGNALVGLPAGDYEIEISGSREKITIEPGKITDF